MSPRRSAAYARQAHLLVSDTGDEIDPSALFASPGDVVLDIGFGGGESVVEMALARPAENIIGIDVHTPGVGRVLEAVETENLHNVRVVEGDALLFVERLPAASLAGVRIWFPDPWPKVRQRDKRLVQASVVTALVDRLRPAGWLHLATDVVDYATQMQSVCDADPRLTGGIVVRPAWRPVTRFERRGDAEGRSSTDLWYDRTA